MKLFWSFLILAALTLNAPAGDWLSFRGPGGSGVSEENNLPATWDGKKNIVWKTRLPGPGGSSPIILGDQVFVTCYTGYGTEKVGKPEDLQRQLVCLNRRDGSVKWAKVIPSKGSETRYGGFIAQHGYASSTPASDGQRIYVFFGKGGVYAFDRDGTQLWQTSVGTGIDGWGSGSSPILYGNLVIVNAGVESGALVALDKTTGTEVWKSKGIRRTWSTPALVDVKDGKRELVLSVPGKVLGLDPETAKNSGIARALTITSARAWCARTASFTPSAAGKPPPWRSGPAAGVMSPPPTACGR